MHWWKQPTAGDILWCHFPQDAKLEPGPKPRPSLVMKVVRVLGEMERFTVQAVYGTSQKVDSLYPGEFLLPKDGGEPFKLSGLSYPTTFDLAQWIELPYNDVWFTVPPRPRHGHCPKLGVLHPSFMPALRAAREAI